MSITNFSPVRSGNSGTRLFPQPSKRGSSSAFLDAAVSEQIARMVAMKGATENAGDMVG